MKFIIKVPNWRSDFDQKIILPYKQENPQISAALFLPNLAIRP